MIEVAQRLALTARGRVQGTGLRPFVARRARAHGLTGWVRNEVRGLRIEVQGRGEAIEAFLGELERAPPPVDLHDLSRASLDLLEEEAFRILASVVGPRPRPVLSPDLATCAECLAELEDSSDRRADYSLISCARCGPRWSIARALPWDRARTSLASFELCPACAAEYASPEARRFHAQTTACAACGPRLDQPLDEALAVLRRGEIVALRGVGGWQLLCDARDTEAVTRLRARKRRPDKPLAVMVGEPPADLSAEEAALMRSPAAPIVLARSALELSPAVNRGRRRTGLMLPTTGAHHRLALGFGAPLVCTSANVAGEPMPFGHEAPEADLAVGHDRPILRPVDDSVALVVDARPRLIRRARGYVPAPLQLREGPTVLALGAHLKATVCLAVGDRAILSAHVGTLGRRASRARLEVAARDLLTTFDARPERIVCDQHPDYGSTHLAEALAAELEVPLLRVQHHHAHVAAVLAEHRLEGPALGFAWDGTGLGEGAIWGSEALRWDGQRMARVAHLRPFGLPGGDAAARSPARCLLGLALQLPELEAPAADALALKPADFDLLRAAAARGVNTPQCTSMGRLFDAVALLLGGPASTAYEAQAAIGLEELAGRAEPGWTLPLEGDELDWRPLIRALLADPADAATRAARFHGALIEAILAVARREARPTVVLGGGCFDNTILLSGARRRLREAGFEVFVPEAVPAGDGGLSLGQAWLGRRI